MAKAPTYGRLISGGKTGKTLMGSKGDGMNTLNETWKGRVRVHLDDDGDFLVFLGNKHGSGEAVIARGNVGDDPIFGRHFIAGDGKLRKVDGNGDIRESAFTVTIENPEVLDDTRD